MTDKLKNAKAGALIGFSARFLVCLFIAVNGFHCIRDGILRNSGKLREETLTYSDFTASSFKDGDDGTVITTDNDPQLILDGERYVGSIKFYMEYTIQPGEIVMYYTEKDGQGFSERKRVWAKPVRGEDGWYEFTMDAKKVKSIRIDPTMYAGNEMTFGDFIINEPQSAASYFAVGRTDVYNLIIYTVILSAVLKFGQELLTKFTEK